MEKKSLSLLCDMSVCNNKDSAKIIVGCLIDLLNVYIETGEWTGMDNIIICNNEDDFITLYRKIFGKEYKEIFGVEFGSNVIK